MTAGWYGPRLLALGVPSAKHLLGGVGAELVEDEAAGAAGVQVDGAALGAQPAEVELVPDVGSLAVEAAAGPVRVTVHLLVELVAQVCHCLTIFQWFPIKHHGGRRLHPLRPAEDEVRDSLQVFAAVSREIDVIYLRTDIEKLLGVEMFSC